MELAVDAVGAGDDVPEHGPDVGGGFGEDAGALVEVGVSVSDDGVGVGLVEVVEDYVGVGDDEVGVGVILEVVAYWKGDPVLGFDHCWAINSAGVDDSQGISWADTTAHQDLGGSERSSGKNNTPSNGGYVDDTGVTSGGIWLNLNTGDVSADADDSPDRCVLPPSKVLSRTRGY